MPRESIKEKKKKKTSESDSLSSIITPFNMFQNSLDKEGKLNFSRRERLAMYKNMENEEKLKYIQEAIQMDTNQEKKISVKEQQILKNLGKPNKPLSAYNMFSSDRHKEYSDDKDILKAIPADWKTLDPEEKNKYVERSKEEHEKWRKKILEWIETLPKEQQAEQYAKHKLLQKVDQTGTKRRRESVLLSNNEIEQLKKKMKTATEPTLQVDSEPNLESPVNTKKEKGASKKKLDDSPALVAQPSGAKSTDYPSKNESTASQKMKQKQINSYFLDNTKSTTEPKKSKLKNFLASLGPFPSLTNAHYFLSHKFTGKPSKIAKRYSQLDRAEKKKFLAEMNEIKTKYLAELQQFAEKNSKYSEKIKNFFDECRREQNEEIGWYKESNTDESSSDGSSSDSE
jgi:hypothetical protein